MTVLKIIGALAALLAVVWSAIALNEFSKRKYNYKPFSIGNIVAMSCAIVMLYISFRVLPEGASLKEVMINAINMKFFEPTSDTVVLACLSLLVALVTYVRMIFKTNLFIATYAIIVQFLAAVLLLIVLVFLAFGKDKKKEMPSR